MNVSPIVQSGYIKRNVAVLKEFARLQDKGKTTREIYPIIVSNLEVSRGLIHALVYTPGYPYREEARNAIKAELKQAEKEGKDLSQALAKIVGYNLTLSNRVPKPQTT